MKNDVAEIIQSLIAEENEAIGIISNANSDKIEFLFTVLARIRLSLQRHVKRMCADKSVSSVTAAFLFCKVIRSCRATRLLCGAGWGIEAELLLRSGLEALISLRYITQQDSEERAILYTEFDHILAEAYAKRVDQWPDLFKDIDLKQRRQEIRLNFERVKANYPIRDFWAGKIMKNGRLREMAQQVGLRWYYDFMYWFASNHAHANVRSAIEVMHISADEKFTYNLGPSNVNTQHPLLLAIDFLLQAYQCIVQFFKLPEEENIGDLIAGYAAISKKIEQP